MGVHHARLAVRTGAREATTDITARAQAVVSASGVRQGLCTIASSHTTAGIFVNENADPDVQRDVMSHLATLVPRTGEFRHAEGNADAHVKTVLTGNAVTLPVRDARLVLGTWQGIHVAEFDGPRERVINVTVIGE